MRALQLGDLNANYEVGSIIFRRFVYQTPLQLQTLESLQYFWRAYRIGRIDHGSPFI